MSSRIEVVEDLVAAGLQAIAARCEEIQPTGDEVISAYFTMLRRAVHSALELTPHHERTRTALRESVYTILADLVDKKLH
jgi:hypothetical protein